MEPSGVVLHGGRGKDGHPGARWQALGEHLEGGAPVPGQHHLVGADEPVGKGPVRVGRLRWATKKYKRFRRRKRKAAAWLSRVADRSPELLVLWKGGVTPRAAGYKSRGSRTVLCGRGGAILWRYTTTRLMPSSV